MSRRRRWMSRYRRRSWNSLRSCGATIRLGHRAHHPRYGRGSRSSRPGDGDVCGSDRRARHETRPLQSPWHPYSWALLDSIPPLEGARLRRLKSIGGSPPSLLALPPGCAFAPRCRHRFHRCGERPELTRRNGHQAACFLPPLNEAARDLAHGTASCMSAALKASRRSWRRLESPRISSSAGARRGRGASSMPSTMSR